MDPRGLNRATARPGPRTVIDRIWDEHAVAETAAAHTLLHIDRIFLHERTGPALLAGLAAAGRMPRHPQRVFGCMDHIVDTTPLRSDRMNPEFSVVLVSKPHVRSPAKT